MSTASHSDFTASPLASPHLGWLGIIRLGLVQTALGAIFVLATSTLNRVMVVEYALPATLPGVLVGIHYALQVFRPRWGYGADKGQRTTPWIIGGMAMLAAGGFLATCATVLMGTAFWPGLALSVLAFVLIGIGVGASGTSVLALLAKRVAPDRKAPAATIVWVMMICGFIISAITMGKLLDPYSPERLIAVAGGVCLVAFLVATLAITGLEGQQSHTVMANGQAIEEPAFREAITEVWADPRTRLFAIFIVVSMLAYSGQDLILEPFAGIVFGFTPGGSTKLSGIQHGGVLTGMVFVGLAAGPLARGRLGSLPFWTMAGCMGSAAILLLLVVAANFGPGYPLTETVFALGVMNGIYAAAAIGSMMMLASVGRERREGTRMGLWGAGQALAMGAGGLLGAAAVDLARIISGSPFVAYASVFTGEALLFLVSAALAAKIARLSSATENANADPRQSGAYALGLSRE